MHPFLNTEKLTDEEIVDRLNKCHLYLRNQTALGHGPTVSSIKDIIASLEAEYSRRIEQTIETEHKKKYPEMNSPIELGKLED